MRKRKRKEKKTQKKEEKKKTSWFSTTIFFFFSVFISSLSLSQKVLAYKNRIQSESTTTKSIRLSSAA
jgi:hypothetical protein